MCRWLSKRLNERPPYGESAAVHVDVGQLEAGELDRFRPVYAAIVASDVFAEQVARQVGERASRSMSGSGNSIPVPNDCATRRCTSPRGNTGSVRSECRERRFAGDEGGPQSAVPVRVRTQAQALPRPGRPPPIRAVGGGGWSAVAACTCCD